MSHKSFFNVFITPLSSRGTQNASKSKISPYNAFVKPFEIRFLPATDSCLTFGIVRFDTTKAYPTQGGRMSKCFFCFLSVFVELFCLFFKVKLLVKQTRKKNPAQTKSLNTILPKQTHFLLSSSFRRATTANEVIKKWD